MSIATMEFTAGTEFIKLVQESQKQDAEDYWKRELGGVLMLEHAAAKLLAGMIDPRDVPAYVGCLENLEPDRMSLIEKIAEECR